MNAPWPDEARLRDPASRFGRYMVVGLWVLVLGFGTWYANLYLEERQRADEPLVLVSESGQPAIELESDGRGHYLAAGEINGERVDFLIDTGASRISIPAALADRIGLDRGRSGVAQTANGTVRVWDTELDEVRLGPLSRTGVEASINPGMRGRLVLLGMSFLRDFELLQRDGRLVIRDV